MSDDTRKTLVERLRRAALRMHEDNPLPALLREAADHLAAPVSQATLAKAWWRGRRSAHLRHGEWAGPELRERCAKDIADLVAAPLGERDAIKTELLSLARWIGEPGNINCAAELDAALACCEDCPAAAVTGDRGGTPREEG